MIQWFTPEHTQPTHTYIHTHTTKKRCHAIHCTVFLAINPLKVNSFELQQMKHTITKNTDLWNTHIYIYWYYQFLVKWTHIISESANLLLPWTVFCRILPFLRYLSTSNSSIFMPSLSFEWVSHPISWCLSVSDSVDHHKRPLPITKGKMIIIEFENPIWFFYHKYRHGHTERNKKKRSMEEKMIFFFEQWHFKEDFYSMQPMINCAVETSLYLWITHHWLSFVHNKTDPFCVAVNLYHGQPYSWQARKLQLTKFNGFFLLLDCVLFAFSTNSNIFLM